MEGLDKTDGLVNRASDGEIIDGDLAQGTLGIDDEQTAQGNALVFKEDAVVTGDGHVAVSNQGKLKVRAKTALLAALGSPGEMGELGVGGDTCRRQKMLSGYVVGNDEVTDRTRRC